MEKGDAVVEDGSGGDFGKHDGDNEFGNLNLADLTFAHEAHGYDQGEIEDDGADKDGEHEDSVRDGAVFIPVKRKTKNIEKISKKVLKRY